MRSTVLFAVLWGVLTGFPASAALPGPVETGFDVFSVADQIPGPTVYALLQDKDRFLWAGGENGLARTDGTGFRGLETSRLPHPTVLDLLQDPRGRIWVATPGGIALFNPADESFTPFVPPPASPGSPAPVCWKLGAAADGRVLVGTLGQGLLLFDPETKAWAPEPRYGAGSLKGKERTLGLLPLPDGRFWVSSFAETGLADGKGLQTVGLAGPDGKVQPFGAFSFFQDKGGRILAGYLGGYAAYDPVQGAFVPVPASQAVGSARVRSMAEDRWGRLWCATDLGLAVFQGDQFQFRMTANGGDPRGLPGAAINRVLADDAGGIVLGIQQGGLARWDPWMQPVRALEFGTGTFHEFAAPSTVTALAPQGTDLYFATSQGMTGLYRTQTNQAAAVPLAWPSEATSRIVYSMAAAPGGALWLAAGTSFLKADPKTGKTTLVPLGAPGSKTSVPATYFVLAHRGEVWISSVNSGLGRVRDGPSPAVEWFNPLPPGPTGLPVRMDLFRPGPEGNGFWIATEAGLVRWTVGQPRGEVHPLTVAGVPAEKLRDVNDLAVTPGGQVWVASAAGLTLYDPAQRRGTQVALGFGPADTAVVALALDGQGRLWGGTPKGWFLREADGSQVLRIGTLDGLVSDAASLRCLRPAEGLGFVLGGNRGLGLVDPARFRTETRPVRPALTQVVLDGKPVPLPAAGDSQVLTVPPGTQRLDLVVSPFTFLKKQKILYQAQIAGFDRTYRSSPLNQFSYTNIPPGTYQVAVRIQVNDKSEGPSPVTTEIRVGATFLQSPWFFALVALGFLGLGFLAAQVRNRQVRKYNERLRAEVDEKTRELDERNTQLVTANRHLEEMIRYLEETRGKLAEAEKLTAMGRLVGGLAHELNTPLGTGVTTASFVIQSLGALEATLPQPTARQTALVREMQDGHGLIMKTMERLFRLVDLLRDAYLVGWVSPQTSLTGGDLKEFLGRHLDGRFREEFAPVLTWKIPPELELEIPLDALCSLTSLVVENALVHGYGRRREGPVEIGLRSAGGHRELTIADQGVGIEESELSKVKEPFYKIHGGSEGFGLGLTVAWLLATNVLKGTLDIDSLPGRGTTVTVRW